MNRILTSLLARLWTFVCDVAYGIHAGNAIRHGLPVPRRRGNDADAVLRQADRSGVMASRAVPSRSRSTSRS